MSSELRLARGRAPPLRSGLVLILEETLYKYILHASINSHRATMGSLGHSEAFEKSAPRMPAFYSSRGTTHGQVFRATCPALPAANPMAALDVVRE